MCLICLMNAAHQLNIIKYYLSWISALNPHETINYVNIRDS